jgi:hypothetical protein
MLAEWWNLTYADAMAMPWSRRKRLLQEKDDLERKRNQARKESGQMARRRR